MQSLSIGRKSKARSGIFEGDENRAIGFHERALAAAFGRVRQGFAMAVAGRPSVVSREVSSRSAAAQDSATVHTRVPSAKTGHQKRSDSTAVTSQLPLRIPELKGSTEGTDECESEERRSEATRIPTRAAASLHSTKRATAHGEALCRGARQARLRLLTADAVVGDAVAGVVRVPEPLEGQHREVPEVVSGRDVVNRVAGGKRSIEASALQSAAHRAVVLDVDRAAGLVVAAARRGGDTAAA